jgi:segregation and condensation protein B
VTEFELAHAVGVPESVVAETLAELVAFYDETGRGFELRQVGGWLAVLHPRGARGPDHPNM